MNTTTEMQESCVCGAVYGVRWHHAAIPHAGSHKCIKCGQEMGTWDNTNSWPEYTFLRSANAKDADPASVKPPGLKPRK
jgi:hypothetical protein